MPEYLSPGVYVEEVPSAIKPIAGASTSTAAFLGLVPDQIHLVAPAAPDAEDRKPQLVAFTVPAAAGVPLLVTNWSQFTRLFGDLVTVAPAAKTKAQQGEGKGGDKKEEEDKDGKDDKDDGKKDDDAAVDEGHRNLVHAVYGYFNNGGSRCYVVRCAEDKVGDALLALGRIDEVSIVAAPGIVDDDIRGKVVAHCASNPGRFAILDGVAKIEPESLGDLTHTGADEPEGVMPARSDLAAWYFPWIRVVDPGEKMLDPKGGGIIEVPPSGHVAGVYARVDTQRGVHKAPANEVILGALGVAQALSQAEQNGLNPEGVNCIRVINGSVTVWGARTVGGDLNADLKYINVRRTLLFLRKSIEAGTQWVVFEPNDPALWQKITRNVDAFLTNVWRSGALLGNTPAEAFYVKCDAGTNPPELRDIGQVVTEVGVALVRPAEFVIFRISQMAAAE